MEAMFRDRRIMRRRFTPQNKIVAREMTRFFQRLPSRSPEIVAKEYGRLLLNSTEFEREANFIRDDGLLKPKLFRNYRSRFSICLATDGGGSAFDDITKRVALVSDTLMLTHHLREGQFHDLDTYTEELNRELTPAEEDRILADFKWELGRQPGASDGLGAIGTPFPRSLRIISSENERRQAVGMFCPDLTDLGRWILDAEPILKAGLACYLPSYALRTVSETQYGKRLDTSSNLPYQAPVVDLLIQNRRAVDTSGVEPLKTQLVRPVLRMDLPFIDGVSLREFSDITVGEFASYSAFRDFLRQAFLDLDEGMNAVESDRELVKIGLQIKDQVRATRSAMERSRRKRAVAVSGAAIGSVGAILVAVYGPALAAAVAALGASGGVWGIINAFADNDIRTLKQDSWYYVWAIAEASHNTYI